MIKRIMLSERIADKTASKDAPVGALAELRPDLGEKKSRFYAVCTNSWGDKQTARITMCTYAEPIGDLDSYIEAKAVIDSEYNGKKKCSYCGFSHFRASEYDYLSFDNEYASLYFDMDQN